MPDHHGDDDAVPEVDAEDQNHRRPLAQAQLGHLEAHSDTQWLGALFLGLLYSENEGHSHRVAWQSNEFEMCVAVLSAALKCSTNNRTMKVHVRGF